MKTLTDQWWEQTAQTIKPRFSNHPFYKWAICEHKRTLSQSVSEFPKYPPKTPCLDLHKAAERGDGLKDQISEYLLFYNPNSWYYSTDLASDCNTDVGEYSYLKIWIFKIFIYYYITI